MIYSLGVLEEEIVKKSLRHPPVTKVAGGTTTIYVFSAGKVIAEYDNGAAVTSPSREYIYSGGVPLVKIDSGGLTYYHADHLSARLLTDSSGSILGQQGHFPFGEIWYETGTTSKFKFTTYERDAESGNDYAMARFHVNRLGRFSSPDALAGSNVNPQSLNRYSYVGNDPIRLIDPSGMLCEDTNGQQDPSCQSGENFIQNNPPTPPGELNDFTICEAGGTEVSTSLRRLKS